MRSLQVIISRQLLNRDLQNLLLCLWQKGGLILQWYTYYNHSFSSSSKLVVYIITSRDDSPHGCIDFCGCEKAGLGFGPFVTPCWISVHTWRRGKRTQHTQCSMKNWKFDETAQPSNSSQEFSIMSVAKATATTDDVTFVCYLLRLTSAQIVNLSSGALYLQQCVNKCLFFGKKTCLKFG